jgi:hypothetical protein
MGTSVDERNFATDLSTHPTRSRHSQRNSRVTPLRLRALVRSSRQGCSRRSSHDPVAEEGHDGYLLDWPLRERTFRFTWDVPPHHGRRKRHLRQPANDRVGRRGADELVALGRRAGDPPTRSGAVQAPSVDQSTPAGLPSYAFTTRCRHLSGRDRHAPCLTSVARELAGFVWNVGQQVEAAAA